MWKILSINLLQNIFWEFGVAVFHFYGLSAFGSEHTAKNENFFPLLRASFIIMWAAALGRGWAHSVVVSSRLRVPLILRDGVQRPEGPGGFPQFSFLIPLCIQWGLVCISGPQSGNPAFLYSVFFMEGILLLSSSSLFSYSVWERSLAKRISPLLWVFSSFLLILLSKYPCSPHKYILGFRCLQSLRDDIIVILVQIPYLSWLINMSDGTILVICAQRKKI